MPRIPKKASDYDARKVVDHGDYDPVRIADSKIIKTSAGADMVMWTLTITEDGPFKDENLFMRHGLEVFKKEKDSSGSDVYVTDKNGKNVVDEKKTEKAIGFLKRFYMTAMGIPLTQEEKVPDDWATEDCHGRNVAVTVTIKEYQGIPGNEITSVRISEHNENGGGGRRRRK